VLTVNFCPLIMFTEVVGLQMVIGELLSENSIMDYADKKRS